MATTKKPAPKPPVKRSKPEMQQEFDHIRDDAEMRRAEANPKQEDAAREREADLRSATAGISVEAVVQRITALGLDVQKALAGISGQLTGEVDRLRELRDASELERSELSRLHKIDIAAATLDELLEEHRRQKAELDHELNTERAQWEQERFAVERDRKEQEDNLRKARQREAEEFEYKKAQERKKAQDKYDEDQRLVERKNKERQEALEKSWEQREARLKEAEDELKRLRAESAQFPERLRAEVDKAASDAHARATAELQQQIALSQKEAEGERRIAELRIKSLDEQNAKQAAQIESLQTKLDGAKQQVQDIAIKAIEGASGARALTHVNQIAMEQAKQRSPQS